MDDEISIPISLPLDTDGFLRRECPNCEQEFKWFSHDDGDADAEHVDQYFCPRCGQGSGLDTWWTPAQLEYAQAAAAPAIDDAINNALDEAFGSFRNNKFIKVERTGTFSLDIPTPEPLHDDNVMVIVEPPCHPNEPVKIPDSATNRIHCLICGNPFAA